MRNSLRAHIALTGVIGAVPGAPLGAAILRGGIVLLSSIGLGAAGGQMTDREAANLVTFVTLALKGSFIVASALMFSTSMAAVWLRYRKHPDAAVISPTAVGIGTTAGCILGCWAVVALSNARAAGLPSALPYAALAAAFGGAFGGTFLRGRLLVGAVFVAAVMGLLAVGDRYAQVFLAE